MKYILTFASLMFVLSISQAQKDVNWMTWQDAMEAAEKNPKKLYVDIYTDWCGYCKKMDKTTFKDPATVKYLNENFYPVKFNAEQKDNITFNDTEFKYITGGGRGVHELAYALLNGRLGYPAFVILDEEFARILISPGFKGPDAVMMEMKFATEEKYKVMAWTTFQNDYKIEQYQKAAAAKNQTNANATTKPVATNKTNSATSKQAAVNTRTNGNTDKTDITPKQKAADKKDLHPGFSKEHHQEGELYKVVEEMPRFPGCEDLKGTANDKSNCASGKMLQFVYNNLVYPDEARAKGVEGMVVLQFTIDKSGKVKDGKVVRDLGSGCGEAALAILDKMPEWIPGKQRGKAVDVLFTMPVRFVLEKTEKKEIEGK